MITFITVTFSFIAGMAYYKCYILKKIQKDIELNQREEFNTSLNNEYTEKKIFMYGYIKDRF